MTSPVREQCAAAFAAIFAGLEDELGDAVAVSVDVDTSPTAFPHLVVELGGESARIENWPRMDATLTVLVHGGVQRTPAEGAEDGAQAALRAAVNQLHALALQAFWSAAGNIHLGGIADNVRYVSMDMEIVTGAAKPTGGFTQVWETDTWWAVDNPFSQILGG